MAFHDLATERIENFEVPAVPAELIPFRWMLEVNLFFPELSHANLGIARSRILCHRPEPSR